MTFKNHRTAYFSLRGLTTHSNEPQDLRRYWIRVSQILSRSIFFIDGVNAIRPPVVEWQGRHLKNKVTSVASKSILRLNCSVSDAIYRRKRKFLTKLQLTEIGLCKILVKNIEDELATVHECAWVIARTRAVTTSSV